MILPAVYSFVGLVIGLCGAYGAMITRERQLSKTITKGDERCLDQLNTFKTEVHKGFVKVTDLDNIMQTLNRIDQRLEIVDNRVFEMSKSKK